MRDTLGHVRRRLAALPGRLARGVPWAHVEPAGLGVGSPRAEDADDRGARERRERETWRRNDG